MTSSVVDGSSASPPTRGRGRPRLLAPDAIVAAQRRISFERDPAAELSRRDEPDALSRDRFPTLHKMLPELDAHMSMDDFDRGLDRLLSGFGAP